MLPPYILPARPLLVRRVGTYVANMSGLPYVCGLCCMLSRCEVSPLSTFEPVGRLPHHMHRILRVAKDSIRGNSFNRPTGQPYKQATVKTPWLYRGARHSIIRPSPPRVGVVQLVRTTLRSQSHHKLKYVVNEMTRKVSLFRDGDATGICNNYLSVRYVCIPRIEHRWSERCVKSSVTYLSAIRGEEL